MAMNSGESDAVRATLQLAIGLRVSAVSFAGEMANFQFGELRARPSPSGGVVSTGEYALHVQCPWRIDDPRSVVTGMEDRWTPIPEGTSTADEPDLEHSLMFHRVQDLVRAAALVVADVSADAFPSLVLTFSSGHVLRVFPAGSTGEQWRFFRPGDLTKHLVVVGGRIEETW